MRTNRTILAALAALILSTGAAQAQNVGFLSSSPRRAWLGFSYDAVTNTRGQAINGVVVRDVVSGSPAENAGLAVGDTIVSINQINATQQLIGSLGSALEPGDDVRFDVRRAGRTRTLTITAARPPAEYVGLGPTAGLVRVDGDSLRSLVRVFVDSAFAGIDTLRVPDIFISSADGRFRIRSDSMSMMFSDSFMVRGPGDVSVFSFARSDSLRAEFDSMRSRLRFFEPGAVRVFSDSVWSGRPFFVTPDSSLATWAWSSSPMSFTIAGRSAIAGAELTRLDPAMEEYFGVREGVLVTRVPRDTPAARAGFQAGDVIVRANGTDVATVDELRRQVQRATRDRPVSIEVIRKNRRITIELGSD